MKAVKITESNQSYLGGRFVNDPQDYDEMLPINSWLVTDWGGDEGEFSTIEQEEYVALFNQGPALENEFFEVTMK